MVSDKKSIEALAFIQSEAQKLLKTVGRQTQGYSYTGRAEERLAKYLEIHGRKEGEILGMPTGFEPLDKAVNGIELGEHGAVDYFLVFAPTNMGKSLLTSFMTQAGWEDIRRHDYPAYFALEMKAEEIARNWDNVLGKVSRLALSRGTMSEEMKDRYVEFIDRLKQKKRDMVIYDLDSNGGKPYTVDEIRRILEREGHTRFTLDQLSKVRRSQFSGDLRQRLFDTSAEVREMILETGKAGYVIAQANRDAFKRVKKDADEEVDAGDIGEAFAIVQDASKGISIVKVDDNTFRITVIKGRDNASGQSFLVRYDFETGLVVPLSERDRHW
jgi:replicative DNA helicase